MKIALIDTFFDLSHEVWANGLQKYSRHEIDIFKASAHNWKWGMTGQSLQIAWNLNKSGKSYDLLLVTDMVNLPVFRSALDGIYNSVPIVFYFHENQITYPQNENVGRENKWDQHYGFINYTSALSADQVIFNSLYHKNDFLENLPVFLKQFPSIDHSPSIASIGEKSSVMPIGVEPLGDPPEKQEIPVFIWNHRWEYDKNPESFFEVLYRLKDKGEPFELIVTGKTFSRQPRIFKLAKKRLSDEIIHFGYTDRKTYRYLLSKANIALMTSNQDFFCISFVESLLAGCIPIIPRRLVFAEHIPGNLLESVSYTNDDDIDAVLSIILQEKRYLDTKPYRTYAMRYHWDNVIMKYDKLFDAIYNK